MFDYKNYPVLILCLMGFQMALMAQPSRYAYFTFTPLGQEISFHNSSAPEAEISSYSWDFGDGNSSTDKDPIHFFAGPGSYLVTLTVNYTAGQPAFLVYPIQVTIPDFNGTFHDYTCVQVGGSAITIDVLENDGIDPSDHTLSLITTNGAPFLGMASVNADKKIEYTPGNTTGWDVIEYHVVNDQNQLDGEGYVYVEVSQNVCGANVQLFTYPIACPERCMAPGSSSLWWYTNPSPNNPGACYAYKFVIQNLGQDPLKHFIQHVNLPTGMTFKNGYVGSDNTAGDILWVSPTNQNQTVSFYSFASSEPINPQEKYTYIIIVDVNALPTGGSGGIYHANFYGTLAGPGYADVREGSVCDPNSIAVFPKGCGQWGDIGPNVHQLQYKISFENDGGGMLSNVTVRPNLPSGLIARSVRVLSGLPFAPNKTYIPAGNEINFTWNHINLPPVSQDSIGGKGEVVFTVELDTANTFNGEAIDTWADVFFDQQFPVRTDTAYLTYFDSHPAPFFELGPDIQFSGADTTVTFNPTITGGDPGAYQYLWSQGINTPSASFTQGANTYIELLVTDTTTGCVGHDRVNFFDPTAVSIDKAIDPYELTVYPNPFEDMSFFELEGSEVPAQIQLGIFNSLGQKIYTLYEGLLRPKQVLRLEFDGSKLPAGLYFYQLTNQNGTTTTGRLVHTH